MMVPDLPAGLVVISLFSPLEEAVRETDPRFRVGDGAK